MDLQAYLFSPRRLMEERAIALRAARKTKVQPSQVCRKKRRPKRAPGERYTPQSYGHAIAKAIHQRALELKREAGLDVARAVLGHRQPLATSDTLPAP